MPLDDNDMPHLPDDIAALVNAANDADVPPAGAQASVWARTMERINAPAPVPVPATAAAGAVRMAAVTGFAAGVLSGVAGTYAAVSMFVAAPVTNTVYVPVERGTAVAVAPTPVQSPVRVVTVYVPTATPVQTPAVVIGIAELQTERAWLDAARGSLARGELDAAEASLEKARIRFPEGPLREEREAIGVRIQIARGNYSAAASAFATFRKQHPTSVMLPGLENALGELEARQ